MVGELFPFLCGEHVAWKGLLSLMFDGFLSFEKILSDAPVLFPLLFNFVHLKCRKHSTPFSCCYATIRPNSIVRSAIQGT